MGCQGWFCFIEVWTAQAAGNTLRNYYPLSFSLSFPLRRRGDSPWASMLFDLGFLPKHGAAIASPFRGEDGHYTPLPLGTKLLGGRFGDIFYFFLLGGGGRGVRGARRGGGIGFLLNIPPRGGGGCFPGGAEGPGGCLRRIGEFWGGGGLSFFFFVPKTSSKIIT